MFRQVLVALSVSGFVALNAADIQGIRQEIFTNPECIWKDQAHLTSTLTASFLFHNHGLVPFILDRIKIDCKTLTGFHSFVCSAVFNRAGDTLVTVSHFRTVKLWDVHTGSCLRDLTNKDQMHFPTIASFTRSGDTIVTADYSGNDIATRYAMTGEHISMSFIKGLYPNNENKLIHTLALNGTRDLVSIGLDGVIRLWDVDTNSCVAQFSGDTGNGTTKCAAFSKNRALVATSTDIRAVPFELIKTVPTAKIWDVETSVCITELIGHGCEVNSIAFNREGNMVVTASLDNTAKVWDVVTGMCKVTLVGHKNTVYTASFNRAGTMIVTGSSDNTAKLWDAETGTCIATLHGHAGYWIKSALFNRQGTKVVTISAEPSSEHVKIWDISAVTAAYQSLCKRDDIRTLYQACLLDVLYETVLCRRLVQKKGDQTFTSKAKALENDEIFFDFNEYKHLEEHYAKLPKEVQEVFDPYVRRTETLASKILCGLGVGLFLALMIRKEMAGS